MAEDDLKDFIADLDLSQVDGATLPEAVEEAPEPEATEPTEPEAVPTVEDPAGDPSDDEDEGSDSDDEEAPEGSAEDEEDEDGDEDSDEDLDPVEKRIRGLQSLHDRQMAEVQNQLAQMQQWAQQVYQAQLQQQQAMQMAQQEAQKAQQAPIQQVTREQLEGAVEQNVVQAFQWTVANRPDLVATTIALARDKHGHEIADQMQVEYNDYKRQQDVQAQTAMIEAQQQALAERDAPAQIESQMNQIVESIASQYGDAFTEIQGDFLARANETAPAFKEYLESQGLEMTPDAVHWFLNKTVQDVREERLNTKASKPRKPRKIKNEEHIETSTSGHVPQATPEDDAINELLEGARALDMDFTLPTQ